MHRRNAVNELKREKQRDRDSGDKDWGSFRVYRHRRLLMSHVRDGKKETSLTKD